jgi:hypothetical protein
MEDPPRRYWRRHIADQLNQPDDIFDMPPIFRVSGVPVAALGVPG